MNVGFSTAQRKYSVGSAQNAKQAGFGAIPTEELEKIIRRNKLTVVVHSRSDGRARAWLTSRAYPDSYVSQNRPNYPHCSRRVEAMVDSLESVFSGEAEGALARVIEQGNDLYLKCKDYGQTIHKLT